MHNASINVKPDFFFFFSVGGRGGGEPRAYVGHLTFLKKFVAPKFGQI